MQHMLEELKSQYLVEAQEDYVGLWRLTSSLRERYGISDPNEVRQLTLQLVRELLAAGMEAVDLPSEGSGCTPWPDQNHNHVLERIEREWYALGREPNIGDIVWFNLPKRT